MTSRSLLRVVAICITIGCQSDLQGPPAPVFAPVAGVQPYLTDWHLFGPFPWKSEDKEEGLLASGLGRPLASVEDTVLSGDVDVIREANWKPRPAHADNGEIRLHKLLASDGYQGAYAVTDVSSANARSAALLVEADDGVRVYLNGQLVHERRRSARLQQYEDYVPVQLRKGRNQIALKLVTGSKRGGHWDSWSFAVGLRSLEGARKERAARNYLQELDTPLVGPDGRLGLDLRLHERGQQATLEILDGAGRPVRRIQLATGTRHAVDVADLADGVYRLHLRESAAPEAVPFHKGDWTATVARLRKRSAALGLDPDRDPNLAALVQRLALLGNRERREAQPELWAAKVALMLAEWQDVVDQAMAGLDPYRDRPGTHLRGIRSPVDGSTQHYLLHVPRGYRRTGAPIPLVVMVPYQFEKLRPFLESIPVAELGVLGTLARVADEIGVAFLWTDQRGNTYGNDLGESDLFAVIEQVSKDYSIDPDRMTLFGSCVGGREALTLAAKYPDRFAAVGSMSPSIVFRPYAPTSATDRHGLVAYRQKTPLGRLENLLSVPSLVLHGDQNTHSPLTESRALVKAATRINAPLHLEIVPGATHLRFPADPRAQVFRWLAGQKRAGPPSHLVLTTSQMRYAKAHWLQIDGFASPDEEARIEAWQEGEGGAEIRVSTRNITGFRIRTDRLPLRPDRLRVRTNGVLSFAGRPGPELVVTVTRPPRRGQGPSKSEEVGGPIWDFFTGPFLVVVGTGGGLPAFAEAERMADRFREDWRARYRGEVEIKTDQEIAAADIETRNLLLFGEPAGTGSLARLGARLPFRRQGQELVGPGGVRFQGDVVAQYVIPNPLQPRRYLLVAANPAHRSIPVDPVQLSIKGWYDYAVWRLGASDTPALADVGRFDSSWSRLTSELGADPSRPSASGRQPARPARPSEPARP